MTIKIINLNKLLKLFSADDRTRISELRSDLRSERDKLNGVRNGGGHFHYPWWNAAKLHAVGKADLKSETEALVEISAQRARLYPLLTKGFLEWLERLRRSTNQQIGWTEEQVHTHYVVPALELTVKVDNLLALKVGEDRHKLIYPYFSEKPVLPERWARVGLWLMGEALSEFDRTDIEILDVLRGQSFSGAQVFLRGDEESIFAAQYLEILRSWEALRPEYLS